MDPNILDSVTLQFIVALKTDAVMIQQAACSLFYYLATLQICLTALLLVVNGQSLERMFVKFLQVFVTLGIFYALIQHAGVWVPAIINGFIQIGKVGGLTSLDPSSIINQGVSIAGAIIKGFYHLNAIRHPFVSLMAFGVCIAIMIIYAFMAAELTIMLVKSYFLVAIASLFFAFGGLSVTSDMTRNYLKAIVGLGLKLMTLYLLLGVGQLIGSDWAAIAEKAAKNHHIMPMLVIMSAVIVYYMILKNVPSFVAQLSGLGGFQNTGEAAVGVALNTGITSMNVLQKANGVVDAAVGAAARGARAGGQYAAGMNSGFHQAGGSSGAASHGFQGAHGAGNPQLHNAVKHLSGPLGAKQ